MVDMVSTITARELRNVRLTTTYLSAGYNIVEVNEFFERCADALDGKAEMSPEEVEQQMFTTVRFTNGYDIGQIDDPLDRIAETLRHLPVEEPVQPVQPVQPMQPVQPAAQPVQPAQQPIDAQQPAQLPIDSQQTQFVQPTPQTQPAQQPVPQQTQQPVQQTQPASRGNWQGRDRRSVARRQSVLRKIPMEWPSARADHNQGAGAGDRPDRRRRLHSAVAACNPRRFALNRFLPPSRFTSRCRFRQIARNRHAQKKMQPYVCIFFKMTR